MLLQNAPLREEPVDILLATYNGEKHLQQQLNSIAKQTYENWHLIARDDGSADGTARILEAFSRQHPGKVDILHDDKGRLTYMYNFGALMEKSKADHIFFCDQDDVWHDNKIEKAFKAMHELEKEKGKNTPLLVYSDAELIHDNGSTQGLHLNHHWRIPPASLQVQLIDGGMLGCTMMINKPLRDLALPIPVHSNGHDTWCGMLALAAGGVKRLPESTISYRRHEGSVTVNDRNSIKKRVKGMWGSMDDNMTQAISLVERLEERLGSNGVPAELRQFVDIMHAPIWKRPALMLAGGFNNPNKWHSNIVRALITTVLEPHNGRH